MSATVTFHEKQLPRVHRS